ncbi:MAG: 50S ribosomal protein L18 [Patescibacteria group bacterium]|nr:MAG: 50S ribosomal protein L18 [Patescibacteria group bacterium]
MYKVTLRKTNIKRRKLRVRKKVFGTSSKPRLSVHRTNKCISAQLIDDVRGHTLAAATSQEIKDQKVKTKTEVSFEVGKALADRALKSKVKSAVFDRNGYKYHGRVKALAEGAREGGLNI